MSKQAVALQKAIIAVDLGGTNVRVAAFLRDGSLLNWQDQPIQAVKGPQHGLALIYDSIEKVLQSSQLPLQAIGVGSTGPLDRRRGCIQNPYTLPGWEDVDIISPLKSKYQVPVAFENDADAAALGEAWMGAGRGVERLMMVTIGTGIGTGFVLNGKIYRGVDDEHPEGGHILIDMNGPTCYCGARGCWESLVSGPAIAEFARQQTLVHSSYLFSQTQGAAEKITAAMIFGGDQAGDELCVQMVARAGRYIGLGLVSLMMMLLPDCIVLGGGVMQSFERLKPQIKEVITRHVVIIPAHKVKLQSAQLGQQAGIYGAARAAINLLEES